MSCHFCGKRTSLFNTICEDCEREGAGRWLLPATDPAERKTEEYFFELAKMIGRLEARVTTLEQALAQKEEPHD